MVKTNLIDTIKFNIGFLTRTQSSIISAATVLGITSGFTAVLGLVKSRLLTSYFGVADELTVFYIADRIPNLIYSLFVVGVLSTVFIPVYTEAIKKNGEDAHEIASMIISAGLLFFILLGGAAFIFADQIIGLLALGQFSPQELTLGVSLMRIMLGAQLILVISSFLTSLLQSYNYFLLSSLAPILYNLGMIVGIVAFSEKYGIYGAVYGVVIGALAHLFIQVPALRKVKYKYSLRLNFKNNYVQKMFGLIPPRILSVLVANLMATFHNSLALLVSKPSVIHLKFADQLQSFPVNLFGVSVAAAALPALSRKSAPLEKDAFKKIFLTSLHQMFFLVIPCSVILLVLRIPIIRIVYGAAKFPWESTVKTSYTLAFFSLSIFSQSAVFLLTRGFYALKDTKTPVKVAVLTALLNLVLCLTFVNALNWGVWSIAFAYSLTSLIDMVALFALLAKSLGGFEIDSVIKPFLKMSYSAVLMGVSLYLPLKLMDKYIFDSTRTVQLLLITGIAGLFGTVSYLFFTNLLKVEEVELLRKLLRKLDFRKAIDKGEDVKTVSEIEN